jgi:hypothetical protein
MIGVAAREYDRDSIEKIAQLFHSLDPFPYREKDLGDDVEEFIVGCARELPPEQPVSTTFGGECEVNVVQDWRPKAASYSRQVKLNG